MHNARSANSSSNRTHSMFPGILLPDAISKSDMDFSSGASGHRYANNHSISNMKCNCVVSVHHAAAHQGILEVGYSAQGPEETGKTLSSSQPKINVVSEHFMHPLTEAFSRSGRVSSRGSRGSGARRTPWLPSSGR